MENKNIFEGAKFGDKFITRDGKMAILITYNQRSKETPYVLAVQCYNDTLKSTCGNYFPNGQKHKELEARNDIVSRWEETNNEYNDIFDELDVLNMKYLSQVSLYKSLYEEAKNKLEKYEQI